MPYCDYAPITGAHVGPGAVSPTPKFATRIALLVRGQLGVGPLPRTLPIADNINIATTLRPIMSVCLTLSGFSEVCN